MNLAGVSRTDILIMVLSIIYAISNFMPRFLKMFLQQEDAQRYKAVGTMADKRYVRLLRLAKFVPVDPANI